MSITNLRLGTRLFIGFSSLFVILVAVTSMALWNFKTIVKDVDVMTELESRVDAADEWSASTRLNINRVMAIAKSGNAAEVANHFNPLIAQTTERINELQKWLEGEIESAEGKAMLTEISTLRKNYIDARKRFFEEIKSGNAEQAQAILSGQVMPAANAYMAAQESLVKLEQELVKQVMTEVKAQVDQGMLIEVLLSVVGIVIGVLVSFLIARSITQPLREALEFANGVAHGDLSRSIHVSRQDEFGELLRSMRDMQAGLLKVVSQIRQSSEGISQASTEIASGNHDLSARTEQAASSLEETASSMEELTATVKQTAESARQANQMAVNAAEVAQRGGETVGQVVSTMEDIKQSSQKIADIIGVIDGIAFQTNILALNAAVEAARAGEQGRGFAVVAAEVRNLAQRSAQAAREIKDLITASVDKVESGNRIVEAAGATMQEIVDSVSRVTHVIGEITSAAAEQSDGIAQINTAINQLDQMTQQNAALVEQGAAASESLKDQAQRLSSSISTFRT